jgi:hypothetical protein
LHTTVLQHCGTSYIEQLYIYIMMLMHYFTAKIHAEEYKNTNIVFGTLCRLDDCDDASESSMPEGVR